VAKIEVILPNSVGFGDDYVKPVTVRR